MTDLVTRPSILLEKVIKNSPELLGRLVLPDGKGQAGESITLITTGDFSFSLGNDWKELFNMDSIYGMGSKLTLLGSLFEGTTVPNFALVNKSLATLYWVGSKKPSFSVSCVYIATERNKNTNPVEMIKKLSVTSLPNLFKDSGNKTVSDLTNGLASRATGFISGIGNGLGELVSSINTDFGENIRKFGTSASTFVGNSIRNSGLTAPLDYTTVIDKTEGTVAAKNTVSLFIGKWFQAHDLVVSGINSITFSREVIAPVDDKLVNMKSDSSYRPNITDTSYGYPLYVTFTLELQPVAPLTVSEFQNYLITPQMESTQISQSVEDLDGTRMSLEDQSSIFV